MSRCTLCWEKAGIEVPAAATVAVSAWGLTPVCARHAERFAAEPSGCRQIVAELAAEFGEAPFDIEHIRDLATELERRILAGDTLTEKEQGVVALVLRFSASLLWDRQLLVDEVLGDRVPRSEIEAETRAMHRANARGESWADEYQRRCAAVPDFFE